MTVCNVKKLIPNDEPTDYLLFFSALQQFLAYFRILFCFCGPQTPGSDEF